MTEISQKTLNWLYSVLLNGYQDVNRTYSDVAQIISTNPNFAIRTDVYTFENGRSSLLLNIAGTLPVSFRGTTYMFPFLIWIPHEYPRAAPITFVTPTKKMAIRAGQYVSAEGRVYHPYLAGWREDRSSIKAFLSILQEVFAREPPVVSRQEQSPQPPSMPQQSNSIPPPVPPLPPELGRSEPTPGQTARDSEPLPPPRPPKANGDHLGQRPYQAKNAPPVPPHPGNGERENYAPTTYQQGVRRSGPPVPQYGQYPPQRIAGLRNEYAPGSDLRHRQVSQHLPPQQSTSPISPITPLPNQSFPRHAPQGSAYPNPNLRNPQPQFQAGTQGSTSIPWQQNADHFQPPHPPYQQSPHSQQPPPKPQEDLLTSPFDTAFPTPAAEVAPPPIPPNPQKDALLQAISQTLTQQIQSTHTSNMSAIPPLRAQQAALNETLSKISHEMSQLSNLQALLDSNEKILRQAMVNADKVLDDAKQRDVPAVEEVLVAPTVVAGQLYESVIEEMVLEECRTVVGKALDKGRIGGDIWAKQTRSLAREEFLKKALIKKISKGMGLMEDERWH